MLSKLKIGIILLLKKCFKNVKLIYTELFILKTKKEICFKLAELGLRDETTYGFNLPSDFFLKNFTNDIEKLCEYADIIFANEAEALLFCKLLNFKSGNNENWREYEYLPDHKTIVKIFSVF